MNNFYDTTSKHIVNHQYIKMQIFTKNCIFSYREHAAFVGTTYHGMACDPKFATGVALVCIYPHLFNSYIKFRKLAFTSVNKYKAHLSSALSTLYRNDDGFY